MKNTIRLSKVFTPPLQKLPQLAKAAGVKKLVLTHFSPRYEETTDLVQEAKTIHNNVEAAEI